MKVIHADDLRYKPLERRFLERSKAQAVEKIIEIDQDRFEAKCVSNEQSAIYRMRLVGSQVYSFYKVEGSRDSE